MVATTTDLEIQLTIVELGCTCQSLVSAGVGFHVEQHLLLLRRVKECFEDTSQCEPPLVLEAISQYLDLLDECLLQLSVVLQLLHCLSTLFEAVSGGPVAFDYINNNLLLIFIEARCPPILHNTFFLLLCRGHIIISNELPTCSCGVPCCFFLLFFFFLLQPLEECCCTCCFLLLLCHHLPPC